jgi:hypothetical protein
MPRKDLHATDRIVLAGTGFGVWEGGRHLASTRWADVSRVRALKHDALTTDLICVAVSLRDGNEILVHEEVPGFDAFLAAAETRLSGMQPRSAWWSTVVQPAFARNETLLFERVPPEL